MTRKLESEWFQKEKERLEKRKDRINHIGQGRPYQLRTFANLLLVTLLYLRTSAGYEIIGLLFGIDSSTVKRIVKRILPLLQDRFIPKTELTKYKRRINDLDEFLKEYPELKDVIFDGTEFATNRPSKRQKQQYSGKKKHHTKKSQVALDKRTKLILDVSPPQKGKIHDKKQLERTGWDDKLPDNVKRWGDLGYLGMPEQTWIIPSKSSKYHKLTAKQRRENKKISKERIYVEHGNRGMKIFRRIGETIKTKSDHLLSSSILAAANLYNFKRLARQGLG